jgi:hypothetical protein
MPPNGGMCDQGYTNFCLCSSLGDNSAVIDLRVLTTGCPKVGISVSIWLLPAHD